MRVITRSERGLTTAIQRGIDESRGQIVVWMDCDFSMPPDCVPQLIQQLKNAGIDAAIGSRYVPESSATTAEDEAYVVRLQKFLTRRLNKAITKLVAADFHDWTSGFIAIRGPLIRSIRLKGDYGEYFIDLMAQLVARKARFVEVPYKIVPRQHGESKTAPGFVAFVRLGFKYLRAFAAAGWTVRAGRG